MRTLALFLSIFLISCIEVTEVKDPDVREPGYLANLCGEADLEEESISYELKYEVVQGCCSSDEIIEFVKDSYMDNLYCTQIDMDTGRKDFYSARMTLTPETREIGHQLEWLSFAWKESDERNVHHDQFAKLESSNGLFHFNIHLEPKAEDLGPGPTLTFAHLELGDYLPSPKRSVGLIEGPAVELEVTSDEIDGEGMMSFSAVQDVFSSDGDE